MAHYVMKCEGKYPIATIEKSPKLPGGAWYRGTKLSIEVKEPLMYILDPNYPGTLKAMYSAESVPIMNTDLIQALEYSGVDNIELFKTIISNPETEEKYNNYKAFNIIGLVSAADIGIDFDRFTIDEKKASPYLLFRLAENKSAIIVDEKVKNVIEERDIPGMMFYGLDEWSG